MWKTEDTFREALGLAEGLEALRILEARRSSKCDGDFQRAARELWYDHSMGRANDLSDMDGMEMEEHGIPVSVNACDEENRLCEECSCTRDNCECAEFTPSDNFDDDDLCDVYEYWRVDDWARLHLEEVKETVIDFRNDNIWCRTCTGQSTYMDYCWDVITERYLMRVAKDAIRNWLDSAGHLGTIPKTRLGHVDVSSDPTTFEIASPASGESVLMDRDSALKVAVAALEWAFGNSLSKTMSMGDSVKQLNEICTALKGESL